MSETKKSYTLGKIKQLIDLNGDSTNFDLTFNVSCKESTPFNILVVDQTTLDNTPELKYKEVIGNISGKITADKNVFQNYFLILKSDTPCVVEVELLKKELPRTPDVVVKSQPKEKFTNLSSSSIPEVSIEQNSNPKKGMSLFKIVLILVVVIGGVALLWYLYNKNNPNLDGKVNKLDTKSEPPIIEKSKSPIKNSLSYIPQPEERSVSTPKYSQSSEVSSGVMSSDLSGSNNLLNRLRKHAL